MEVMQQVLDIFLHLDKHLNIVIQTYGVWTYLILFLIIFCETGLVITPFLPGDSLLFAAGALAASGSFNPLWLFILLSIAGILGDAVNYIIGSYFGKSLIERDKIRFIKKAHIEKTHQFYEKYGGKTIIIARFIPIVRTFAPFVAGIGHMTYLKFASYNIIGAILWVGMFIFGGYLFGNLPVVKQNFTMVILAIIVISILPPIIEFIKARRGEGAV